MVARRLSGWKPESVVSLNDENDDEAERANAANSKREEAEKRQAPSPFREKPGGDAKQAALLDTYAACIKMCTENKVNEKNSWSLDLIDHMGRAIDEPSGDGGGEMTNFQRASCTLEAGIKIYSYRVDSVYTETFKLMGGLNRSSKRDGQGEEQDEEAGATEDGPSVQKKEKTKRAAAAGMAFLESNPANLSLKKLEVAFDVDPLFHRTSAKFDEGGAKGLLLFNLPVQHGCALVFDSSDAERPAAVQAPTAAPALPLRCISNLIPRNCLELHISAAFSQQHEPAACDWAPGAGGAARSVPEASGHDSDADEHDGAEAEGFDEDAPFEEPLDNDDDAFADDMDMEMDAPVDGREALLQQAQHGDDDGRMAILSVDEMALRAALKRVPGSDGPGAPPAAVATEVAEHEGDLDMEQGQSAEEAVHQKAQQMLRVGQRWAGPGHWKFHAAPKPREAGGGGGRGGKAKSAFVLDFSRRGEALKAVLAMPLESKGTTLSEAALSKASEAENTLPVDCHCSVDEFSQLFHKPAMHVRRGRQVLRAEMLMRRDAALPGGADIPADGMSDGCGEEAPDFGDDDWADGAEQAPPADTDADAEPLVAADGRGAFDLVAQPTRVEKIEIGYAKVAKQVDISALKRSLWELLSDEQEGGAGRVGASAPETSVSFQAVVSRLPEKIPEQKLPDISIAYNFICLLHLANEKGLEITGQDDFADMRVTQPAKA